VHTFHKLRKRSDYNAKLNVVNTKREMTVRGVRMTNDEFCELDRVKRQLVNLRHRFATPERISLIGTLLFYLTSSFAPCDTLVLYAALAESRRRYLQTNSVHPFLNKYEVYMKLLSFHLNMLLFSSYIFFIMHFMFQVFLYYDNCIAEFLKLMIKLFEFILQPFLANSYSSVTISG